MLTDFQSRKVEHLFNMYDINKKGVLEYGDMMEQVEQYVQHLGLSLDEPKAQQIMQQEKDAWMLLEKHCDRDDDGTISRDEFIQCYTFLIMEGSQVEGIIETYSDRIFDSLNTNQDDKITPEEYVAMYPHNREKRLDVFNQLDTNNNGYLSRDEIHEALLEYFLGTDETHPSRLMFGLQ